MLCLDCLECLPWRKRESKEAEPVSDSTPPAITSSLATNTSMDSRSTSETTSKVRIVAPEDLEAQTSLERLELRLPGSRLSLSLYVNPDVSAEHDDDGQGPAKEARLRAMLDFLNAR